MTLPPAFMGLNTSTLNDPSTAAALADAVDGAPLAVTTYGDVGGTILNVVATRTDMTDLVDVRFRGDEGRLIGATRCTTNVVIREPDEGMDTAGSPMSGKLLCWRTSQNLSVSAFVLTRPPAEQDVAAAIDALWPTLG